jgi:hypothetical protein
MSMFQCETVEARNDKSIAIGRSQLRGGPALGSMLDPMTPESTGLADEGRQRDGCGLRSRTASDSRAFDHLTIFEAGERSSANPISAGKDSPRGPYDPAKSRKCAGLGPLSVLFEKPRRQRRGRRQGSCASHPSGRAIQKPSVFGKSC